MLRRLWLLCVLCLASAASFATAAEPIRVGMLGIDNYQSVEYTIFFNNPKAEGDLAGLQITAAYPIVSSDYPRSAELTEMWKNQIMGATKNTSINAHPVEFVDSVDALLSKCDVVMIWSLDGRKHLEQATAVLKAGKPCFIGRPLASSTADAVAIMKVAAETKTPLWSCSQHRYSPGFIGMKNHPEVGKVLGCDVYGGFDMKAAEADLFIRPIHSLETMYTIMGPGCVKVSCTSTPTAESITAIWNDGRVATYRGIKEGAVKYSATVFGDKGVSTAGVYGHGVPEKGIVPVNDKYMGYLGLAAEVAKFFKGGPAPVSPAEMLEIYSLLDAAEASRAQQGATIELKNLLEAK